MNNTQSNQDQHGLFKQGQKNYEFQKKFEVEKYYVSETIKLSLVTGPLYCLSANLQFLDKSVIETYYKSFIPGKKTDFFSNFFLKNSPATSVFRPFKPSYYINYRDAILNIFRQGYVALYKGNILRLSFFISTSQLKKFLEYKYGKYLQFNRVLKEVLTYSVIDMIMHPLLFMESRFSIQPYRKGFRIYNSIFSIFNKGKYLTEIYKGSLYSVPRNIVFVLSLNSYYLYPDKLTNIIAVAVAHVLSYPILTLQRNAIFQSSRNDYLPEKEKNFIQLFKNLINTFGFFGLYRGFAAYALATGLWHYIVPTAANQKFYINLLSAGKKENNSMIKMRMFDEEVDDEDFDENKVDFSALHNQHSQIFKASEDINDKGIKQEESTKVKEN
jgi:hypothetical protein